MSTLAVTMVACSPLFVYNIDLTGGHLCNYCASLLVTEKPGITKQTKCSKHFERIKLKVLIVVVGKIEVVAIDMYDSSE